MENLDMKALKAEFDSDQTLQRQFGSFENFLSYKRAGAGEFIADPRFCFGANDSSIAAEVEGPDEETAFDEVTATDEHLKEHFAQTQELQDEFGDAESYCVFIHGQRRRAERAKRLSDETVQGFDETKATDDQLKEHFAKTEHLQDQFSDPESYLAYVRHQRRRREKEEWRMRQREAKEARAKVHAELVGQT